MRLTWAAPMCREMNDVHSAESDRAGERGRTLGSHGQSLDMFIMLLKLTTLILCPANDLGVLYLESPSRRSVRR